MEPVLFYGVPQGCSFGSIVALEWLGAPYRLSRVEMPAEVQGPAFARINPVRETPALMLDDGRVVTESAAILAALVARDPGHRLGAAQGTADFDRLNQAMSYLTTTYFAAFAPLWTAYEMAEDPPVQAMLRTLGREQVAKAHGQLDAMLEGRDWLAATVAYYDENRRALRDLLAEHLPAVGYRMPEGTYIAWLDVRRLGLGDDPAATLRERAGLAVTDGRACGAAGAGHVRVILATPRPVVEQIVQRLASAVA